MNQRRQDDVVDDKVERRVQQREGLPDDIARPQQQVLFSFIRRNCVWDGRPVQRKIESEFRIPDDEPVKCGSVNV